MNRCFSGGLGFIKLYRRQGPKPPQRKKCKMAKWLSGETLQMLKKEEKAKGERERYTQLNAEFQRIARRDKKVFLSE